MPHPNKNQLRLLQILVGEPTGGAERFFVKLATALHERGIVQKLAILEDEARARELRDAGCDVSTFAFGKGLADWRARWQLQRMANSFAPTHALAWMNRAARRMPKGPFTKIGRIGGYYYAKNYRRCDWIIANAPDLERFIVEDGWPASHVRMISNFGEMAPLSPVMRAALSTPAEAIVLLALGRLHHSKGFDLLLRAASDHPHAHIWLAGSGEEETALRNLAAELGTSERVHFLGWRDDQAALLAACDLCVVPSRHEPLSNVVLEAWSLGVPVLASTSEGPSWLIDHEENGLLFKNGDAADLSAKLRALLANEEHRKVLAAAGKAQWQAHFSKQAIVDRYLAFFDETMPAR